jgi:hypothetical protein
MVHADRDRTFRWLCPGRRRTGYDDPRSVPVGKRTCEIDHLIGTELEARRRNRESLAAGVRGLPLECHVERQTGEPAEQGDARQPYLVEGGQGDL